MSEPGHVLEEAVRLLDTLRRRLGETAAPPRRAADADDVWGRATREEPVHQIATGAPECRYCPVCRAIAAAREARESHPGIADRAADVGQSVVDLLRESLAALDTPPTGRPRPTPTDFASPSGTPAPAKTASGDATTPAAHDEDFTDAG